MTFALELAEGANGPEFFAIRVGDHDAEMKRTRVEIIAQELSPLPKSDHRQGYRRGAVRGGSTRNWELSADRDERGAPVVGVAV